MPGGVSRERRNPQLFRNFLQGVIAHTDHPTHRVGDGQHIGRSFGIFKKECLRIAIVGVAPAMEDGKHLRSEHSPDDFGATVGPGGLRTREMDLAVDDVLITKKEHIPEIDAIAQTGSATGE